MSHAIYTVVLSVAGAVVAVERAVALIERARKPKSKAQ